jgi:hypothetical protein
MSLYRRASFRDHCHRQLYSFGFEGIKLHLFTVLRAYVT